MKHSQLFLAVITTLCAAACSKDRPAQPSPVPEPVKKTRLEKVERNSFFNTALGYNGQGQLDKVTRTSYGMTQTSEIIYGADGKLAEVRTSDYRLLYYYKGDKLASIALINIHLDPANTNPQGYGTVIWSGDNITGTKDFGTDTTGMIYHKSTFDYYPNGDLRMFSSWNFIQEENRFVRELAESYTYDDKHSPWPPGFIMLYSPYNELGDFLPAAHNIKTQTSYGESDEAYAVRTFTYTYNADGYPQQAVSTWDFMDPRDPTIIDTIHYSYSSIH